jgi:WD40 repeat protein
MNPEDARTSHDTPTADEIDVEFDRIGGAAGAALRRSAPPGGPTTIARAARRRRAVQYVAVAAIAFVAVGTLTAALALRDPDTSDTAPVATAPATTTPATTTTPVTAPASTSDAPAPTSTAPAIVSTTEPPAPQIGEIVAATSIDGDVQGVSFGSDGTSIVVRRTTSLELLDRATLRSNELIPCPVQSDGFDPAEAFRWTEIDLGGMEFLGEGCHLETSTDGRFAAISSGGSTAILSTETGERLGVVTGDQPSFSPTNGRLVTSGFTEVAVWDPATMTKLAQVETIAPNSSRRLATFTTDGRWLLTYGRKGLKMWDSETYELVHDHADVSSVFAARLDPTGERVAAAAFGGAVVWDVTDGDEVARMGFLGDRGVGGAPYDCGGGDSCVGGEIFGVEWSPDGDRVVTSGLYDAVRLYDAASGDEIGSIRACFEAGAFEAGAIRMASWLDDDTIVVADSDGCLAVVEVSDRG